MNSVFHTQKPIMQSVTLMAVGDISLQTKHNKPPFDLIKAAFVEKDVLFGNLETSLSSRGRPAEKAVVLNTLPDKALYLKEAGFDVLNVANNHIMDMGPDGVHETLKVLDQHDLFFIGVRTNFFDQSWVAIEKRGIRLGFLGYYAGRDSLKGGIWINRIHLPQIIRDIEFLRHKCDFIVVSLHWGIEKAFYPSPKQVALAHKLIDSGATIILGHHPHVIQGIERYKNGLIAYSLGNFQFEFDPEECSGRRNKRTNQSFILSIELSKDGLEGYDIIPIMINEDFVPYIPIVEKQEEIRHFLSEISKPLERGVLTERWWFEQIAWEYLSGNMKSFIVRIKSYGFMHFLQCIRWLLSPFCLRCYAAIIRRGIKRILGRT